MANAAQLSKNNQNGRIRINDSINTESTFNDCVQDTFVELQGLYPEFEFSHRKLFKNTELIQVLNESGLTAEKVLLGGEGGQCRPDGGSYLIKCQDDTWMPVFIGENKWQDDNPGNALERAVKNIVFFQHYLVQYDYFPYLLNLNGSIVNPNKGSYFDRITMVGGYMPVNKVFVRNDPDTPRIRPFTFMMNPVFQYETIRATIKEIVSQSLRYLADIEKIDMKRLDNC